MALIARYNKSEYPWRRTTGVYGHLPKFTRHSWVFDLDEWGEITEREKITFIRPRLTDVGYLVLITKKRRFTFWYMGNPYRHKLVEVFHEVRDAPPRTKLE